MSSVKRRGNKVYITQRVLSSGIELLKKAGCQITEWPHDNAVPRDELLKSVAGVDAIFCHNKVIKFIFKFVILFTTLNRKWSKKG